MPGDESKSYFYVFFMAAPKANSHDYREQTQSTWDFIDSDFVFLPSSSPLLSFGFASAFDSLLRRLIKAMSAESCHLNVPLPNGLCDLLRDITNEAIRCQPRNLCEFIADYLQLREFMARDKFVRTRNGEESITFSLSSIVLTDFHFPEAIASVLSPEFVGTVDKIFKSCAVERAWRCYCVNRLLREFARLEKLLIKGDTVYEMILNNRVASVIMDEEKLISDAVHRCKLSEPEISSLRQTNRLCLDRFLHKLLNDGRVSYFSRIRCCNAPHC